MKITITILFLVFITTGIFSQEIDPGEYISTGFYDPVTREAKINAEYHETISFGVDGNFTYKYSDCLDKTIGFGKYNLSDNFLNLEFLDFPHKDFYGGIEVTDSSYADSDSITIDLRIQDVYEPLASARVIYETDLMIIAKTSSDEKGNAKLRFPKKNIPGSISVTYVGYEQLLIPIQNTFDKKISVKLSTPYKTIEKGKIISYSIKDIDLDGFYLKGGIWSNWTFFIRTKKYY